MLLKCRALSNINIMNFLIVQVARNFYGNHILKYGLILRIELIHNGLLKL